MKNVCAERSSVNAHQPLDENALSPLAKEVLRALSMHTAFANQVLAAQLARLQIDATTLEVQDLVRAQDDLVAGVARFTSPTTGQAVKVALRALIEG